MANRKLTARFDRKAFVVRGVNPTGLPPRQSFDVEAFPLTGTELREAETSGNPYMVVAAMNAKQAASVGRLAWDGETGWSGIPCAIEVNFSAEAQLADRIEEMEGRS